LPCPKPSLSLAMEPFAIGIAPAGEINVEINKRLKLY
jgi:hypothetical protein